MADSKTKTAKPRPAAARATTSATTEGKAGTATINISKEKHGGTVRGAINGQKFELPVGKDVQVTEGQLNALRDSHVEFTTVTPLAGAGADEGSSASAELQGTATRLEPAAPKLDAEGKPIAAPELRQITDKELTDGTDQKTSKEQAEA
ncbi:MAG: hypothetical protein ACREBP_03150 [Sphingomicrobium sp.]